ncbi:hypothetical protein AVEN_254232-1 [Araneus ventricosus]|uniref:Uncharacterized protein n=1 Tax=Araneus ventricosus TaxID=182803 RepID=A0A4Y2PC05_ARAVE|nr:hypothetical protein AVEN_254232-1 [Araneus ventricosus]
MEILEQGKEKNKRQGRKLMENSIAAGKTWISDKPSSRPSCTDSLGGILSKGASNDLNRLGPRDEVTFIGNLLSGGDRRAAVEG